MTADLVVVHVVPRSDALERTGWTTSDGATRHEVVAWRELPATLATADVVVAHGLAALVVVQRVFGAGPRVVYRAEDARRSTRRRLASDLHADWVAAPTLRIARATAAALGLYRECVTVFRDDRPSAWDDVVAALPVALQAGAPPSLIDRTGWGKAPFSWTRATPEPIVGEPRPGDTTTPARAPEPAPVSVPVVERAAAPTVDELADFDEITDAPPAESTPPAVPEPATPEVGAAVALAALAAAASDETAGEGAQVSRRTPGRFGRLRGWLGGRARSVPGAAAPDTAPIDGETDAAPPATPEVAPVPERTTLAPLSGARPAPPARKMLTAPFEALITQAPRLGTGLADPTEPGHPWWAYRPIAPRIAGSSAPGRALANGHGNGFAQGPGATNGNGNHNGSANGNGNGHSNGSANDNANDNGGANGSGAGGRPPVPVAGHGSAFEPGGGPVQLHQTEARSGVGFFFLGAALLVAIAVGSQLGTIGEGPFLVPLAGLFLTLATIRHVARRRPEEDWIGRWLLLGLAAKLTASLLNFHQYQGEGDSVGYDKFGQQFAHAWLNGGAAPVLPNLRQTNFLRWFTGVVYYIFGAKLLTGTLVFGLLAFAGSYLWYRATVDAVPSVNPRLYLGFVLFAPSILFWPAIVGKEALMQFGLGVLALGVSMVVRQRLVPGFALSAGGGWLVWVVRPHLLALVAIAGGAAYLAGRVRKAGRRPGLLGRPIGIIIIAFLVAFTVGQGAQFLGIKTLSFSSIQAELNTEQANTSIGKSHFTSSKDSLNPIRWPSDAVTVFLRPFPWEIQTSLQILASMESALLALLIVLRFKSLRLAFIRSRESPFLMFCWVLTGLYAIAFSSFSNFGLLVRERSLVLPAVLVLLSVEPALDRARRATASALERVGTGIGVRVGPGSAEGERTG